VASVAVAFLLLEHCGLMLCPGPWYLARFGYNGIFWTSFGVFIDHQGLRNHSFIHTLGRKRFKSQIKIETSKHQA